MAECLQLAEPTLKSLIDNMPGPLSLWSRRGEVEFVNGGCISYFGRDPEDLKDWSRLAHEGDWQAHRVRWQAALESETPYEEEVRLRSADGAYRWNRLRWFPVADGDGRAARWGLLQIDIHGLKEGLDERRYTQAFLASMVEGIGAPMMINNANGEPDAANNLLLSYSGKSVEEIRRWQDNDFVHPDDRERAIDAWSYSVRTGNPSDFEARRRRSDGVYRWWHSHGFPLRDASGAIAHWCVVHTDIEDRKQVEARLAANERSLQQIVDSIPAMAWAANTEGEVDFFNRHFVEYVGMPLEQLKAGRWTEAVHPADVDGLLETWRKVMGAGIAGETEARLQGSGGLYRWFLMRVQPLHDDSGRIIRWYGVNTDIEDRKNAETAMRDVQSELADLTKVMTMGQLTASIAHELNQPLSGIVTNAGTCIRMLSSESPNIEGAKETARRTIRDGNRASEVIKRLRALFSNKTVASETIDLNAAVGEVVVLAATEAQKHRVSIGTELSDGLPPINGDRIQLQRVMLNLILNAIESLWAVSGRIRAVSIRTWMEGDRHLGLAVTDNGIGFDPDAAELLFSPFYTTKSEGMGIGLSVSRTIIKNHNGELMAQLNQDHGSTFRFTIPLKSGDPAEAGGPKAVLADAAVAVTERLR